VLREAARIQEEWPEVEKRLPGMNVALGLTPTAAALHLDIHRDLSHVLEGQEATTGSSGLSHEQEVVLSYFGQPQSIQEAIQISRYEELDTCKSIADLIQKGLLQPMGIDAPKVIRPWVGDLPMQDLLPEWEGPSNLLMPLTLLLLAVPLLTYVPRARGSINAGLASLQPVDMWVVPDGTTRARQNWAFRMASPYDGGEALAKALGRPLGQANPIKDFTKLPDPMKAPAAPPVPEPAPAKAPKKK